MNTVDKYPGLTGQRTRSGRGVTVRTLEDTTMVPCDVAGHAITLSRTEFLETSGDPGFDNLHVEEISVADHVAGNGVHRGYRVNVHPEGDRTFVAYDGTTSTARTPDGRSRTSFAGTWRYTGGTGQFRGITGGGTYEGHVTPAGRVYTLAGTYALER